MAAQKDNAQNVTNYFAQATQQQVAFMGTVQEEMGKLARMNSEYAVAQMDVMNQLVRNAWSHNQAVMTEVNRVGRDMVGQVAAAMTPPAA